jgi:hypothetical protein
VGGGTVVCFFLTPHVCHFLCSCSFFSANQLGTQNSKAEAKKTRASACANPKNSGLLEAFSEIVGYMKDKGEPGYKLGHYYKAINWIQNYEQEIENPMQYSKGKSKVEGIGKGTATKMKQFMDTGTITKLEELRVEAGVAPGGSSSSSSSSSSSGGGDGSSNGATAY